MKSLALRGGSRRRGSHAQMLSRCARAKAFERAGRYDEARDALEGLWRGVGVRPDLNGLDDATAAEALLRVGAVSGSLGAARQLKGVQEAAKDLISEAWQLFDRAGDRAGSIESRIELARCYWRLNFIDEARVMLKVILGDVTEAETELRGIAMLWLAVLEVSTKHYETALSYLDDAHPLIESIPFPYIQGCFFNTRANTLKYLGKIDEREIFFDRALVDYAMASKCFGEAGHHKYRAGVMNNHAMLLRDVGRFREAHDLLDAALELVTSLREKGNIAQIHETRARILIGERRFDEAEYAARRAVRILEEGDESQLQHEALTTHAIALARAARHREAEITFGRAADVALRVGDEEGAGSILLTMIEELGERLEVTQVSDAYRRADALLAGHNVPGLTERMLACVRHTILPRLDEAPNGSEQPLPLSNVYRFPVRGGETFSVSLHDQQVAFRLTTSYCDGDVVFALTPDGCIVGIIRRLADGRLRLESADANVQGLCYLDTEVIVLGVAQ